jgi:gliding motility-associated protein GldL
MSHKKQPFKFTMNTFYSLGAAVVIMGVGCKLLHIPGSFLLIAIGLGVEVIVFSVIAFTSVPEEPDWTLVYPELDKDYKGPRAQVKANTSGDGTAQHLDKLFQDAKIGPDLVQSLGSGLKSFGDKVSNISNMHDAALSTSDFSEKMKGATSKMDILSSAFDKSTASLVELSKTSGDSKVYHEQVTSLAKNLSALNAVYEIELRDSNEHLKSMSKFYSSMNQTMGNFNDSVNDTKAFKDEIAKLSRNLASLNSIYGNMLSAMNAQKA